MENETRTNSEHDIIRASQIVGDQVRSPRGEALGEIQDLVFERESGRIMYAVLAYHEVPGTSDKLFAIPWQALEFEEAERQLILDAKREQLEQAPGFDRHRWPNMADREWQRDVHAHFRIEPYWEELGPT